MFILRFDTQTEKTDAYNYFCSNNGEMTVIYEHMKLRISLDVFNKTLQPIKDLDKSLKDLLFQFFFYSRQRKELSRNVTFGLLLKNINIIITIIIIYNNIN